MALRTTVEQAACNALGSWLENALTDVEVSDRWPEPGQALPDRSVSVLLVGKPTDESVTLRDVQRIPVVGDTTVYDYVFRVRARTHPVQIDVWTHDSVNREDVLAQLEDALTAGVAETIGGTAVGEPVRDGPLVALGDGYTGFADFTFDGPERSDSSDGQRESESRATLVGNVAVDVVVTKRLPRFAEAQLLMVIGEDLEKILGTATYKITATTFSQE